MHVEDTESLSVCKKFNRKKESRIQETMNLLNDADSSTNIFVSAGVKKGADSIFFARIQGG